MSTALFAGSEIWPLVKTGGLADVAHSLPAAMQRAGIDMRVTMPAYRGTLERLQGAQEVGSLQIRGQRFGVIEGHLPETPAPLWLLDCPSLYAREGDPYRDAAGRDWSDNAWRFGCFSEAVAQLACGALGWRADIVHANDWQTGLVPAWLSVEPQPPRSIFTIHNLAYQGRFAGEHALYLGLPGSLWHADAIEEFGDLSFIKAGINCSDAVTTVSPSYAAEIQTPEYGCGLDGLLRARRGKLSGILNGIDDAVWNPASDALLPRTYGRRDFVSGKRVNKAALQAEFGLPLAADAPLMGWVGRVAQQKSSDLLLGALPQLLESGLQFVLLGSGDRAHEQALLGLTRHFPQQMAVHIGFDEGRAHRIEAGADLFLMPSRFEPCGLNQMYSQRYGTIPVVRRTGGLADTVTDANEETLAEGRATGVHFEHADIGGLLWGVRRALELWRQPALWRSMQRAGMKRDFSWDKVAAEYLALYAIR